ncbi:MAG TPA: phage holin family protein [Streptosporangiaceae bacterium]|nr:phage holin family protein [Streptosporangiaceae bacterium]
MSTEQRPAGDRIESRPPAAELGTAELVKQASQQITELVRGELRLAAAEVKDKGARAGMGAGLLGGAGMVAAYGVAALLAAVIAALALVLPVWAAALIVSAVLFAVAAGLAITGRGKVTEAVPPTPDEAIESTKQDLAEIKQRTRR